ncbi:MAG: acyl-CoA reductase, partial [Myxococcota bacterium]
ETDWTVIAETSSEWRTTPLHRFIRLHPLSGVDALRHTLGPLAPHLSSVALAGFESVPAERLSLARSLGRLGACRVCAPGRLQAPPLDWPHDGRALLAPLTRFLEIERGPAS